MTTDAPGASDGSAPVGRDEVVAAILEAAAELFAARGPAATSIRDIAAKSNVNHGLVFRHL
ncbi:TetR family transcriptional regulator, partial [Mycolicibacterium sp. CBMA 361]